MKARRYLLPFALVAGLGCAHAQAPAPAAPIGSAIQDATTAIAAAAPAIHAAADSLAADTTSFSVHIHAVRVSDDCAGQRATAITPDQLSRWIAQANIVYAAAHVRFEFDSTPRTGDWEDLNDSDMNNVTAELPGDPGWERARTRGNEFAARYPRKVVVFFRTGPGSPPTGGGFSSNLYNFVVMPGFDATTICGPTQNIDLFAHELGHYFGLAHTFRPFKTTVEAKAALTKAGNKASAFDGDGLAETPPEPYIESLQCTNDPVVILNGIPFPLMRSNIMSYYAGSPKTMTPGQARIVRQTFSRRFGTALGRFGPYVPDPRRAYSIVALANGRAVEAVPAGTAGADGRARLANWTGAASQNWRFVPLLSQDQGYFEIVSAASGQCLGIDGADMNDGARATLQMWEGKTHQKWRLIRDEKGDLFIEARHSRKVLGAAGAANAAGSPAAGVEQSTDKARASQRWKLLPAD